jgi:hypothetical protein
MILPFKHGIKRRKTDVPVGLNTAVLFKETLINPLTINYQSMGLKGNGSSL